MLEGVLVKRVKPDFKKLGPKYGKIMKNLAKALTTMAQADIIEFEKNGYYVANIDGVEAKVELADVEIISEDIPGWLVANDGNLTVALDVTITDELKNEGLARELVNRIQNVRKSKDFDITDKIAVTVANDDRVAKAVTDYKEYIANQVLAVSIELGDVNAADSNAVELDMDGWNLLITVAKA